MKKIVSLFLCLVTIFMSVGCSLVGRQSDPVMPHLIKSSQKEANPIRHINSSDVETASFITNDAEDSLHNQLSELYEIVVINKKRPNFSGASLHLDVKKVYDEAIRILDRYILNSFSQFETVHAIHDYLTYYVEYDEQLYLDYLANPSSAYESSSFELSGVFLDNTAVCDGFSKAFSFLCAIEGIDSERIEGSCSYSGQISPHAWNKVKIDGVWYNVDVTLDSTTFNLEKGDKIKVIHHGYFLLSDETIQQFSQHTFSGSSMGYAATVDYSVHEKLYVFGQENSSLKAEVTSQQELDAVFEFIKKSKRKYGQVELRLNMGLTDAQAAAEGAYDEQIAKAYKVVGGIFDNKDFAFAPEKGVRPYQKLPRGVFVFLIYR